MKILLTPHTYLPEKRKGPEVYLHRLAKFLQSKGHEIRCLVLYKEPFTYEGIPCVKIEHEKDWRSANTSDFEWADIVFTQIWGVPFAVNKCRQLDKKLLYIAHNDNTSTSFQHLGRNAFIVYNSEQLKELLKSTFRQNSFVLPPPIDYRGFKKSTGDYVTLINHNEDKGGNILLEIAKLLPQVKFLAIEGAYGDQIKGATSNIRYEPQQELETILSRTKILIMPSLIETYGQTAIEAYASGIPVVATGTPGLCESMGEGGIFSERTAEDFAEKILTLLYTPGEYLKASRYGKNRAKVLDPTEKLEQFNNWLTCL